MYRNDDPCLAKVDADEPIFVLRAQDITAPSVVSYWLASLRSARKLTTAKETGALATIDAMRAWQKAHPDRVKVPD